MDNAEKVAIISKELAELQNISINDNIDIFGERFVVISIALDDFYQVYIPGTVCIEFKQAYNSFTFTSDGAVNKTTLKKLTTSGLDIRLDYAPINGGAIIYILSGMLLVACSALNIFMAYKFIADKNSKRYTLYKTFGAKNRDIAMMMILESLIVIVIAFCLGAVVEHFAAKPIVGKYFVDLTIVDYVALFCINAFAVILTTAVLIIKKIVAQPMSSRQRGVQ